MHFFKELSFFKKVIVNATKPRKLHGFNETN